MRARKGITHIGTSGWQYKHWRRLYYPDSLSVGEWLRFYASDFDCVEVNSSFYRLPSEASIAEWCAAVPPRFTFSLKAPRSITHFKKLKNCESQLEAFLARIEAFQTRLGAVVFQLPPRWRCNVRRLEDFLARLPETLRFAFEFRDATWHIAPVYELLTQHGVAFCIYDLDRFTSPLAVTADFVYLRLHGPSAAYTGNYHARTLRSWVGRGLGWNRQGRDVYLFFDNDYRAYAVKNAKRSLTFLAQGANGGGRNHAATAAR